MANRVYIGGRWPAGPKGLGNLAQALAWVDSTLMTVAL